MESKFSTGDDKTVKAKESNIVEPSPPHDQVNIHNNIQHAFDSNIENRVVIDSALLMEEKGTAISVDNITPTDTTSSRNFASPSHQMASVIFGESKELQSEGHRIDSSDLLIKAEKIAFSMGASGRYEENPFSQEIESLLHNQYETGSSKNLLQQEINIGGKENDMDM